MALAGASGPVHAASAGVTTVQASKHTCVYNVDLNPGQVPGLRVTVCMERNGVWARPATWTINKSPVPVYAWIRAMPHTGTTGLGRTWGHGWISRGSTQYVAADFSYQPAASVARYTIEYWTAPTGWKQTTLLSPPG